MLRTDIIKYFSLDSVLQDGIITQHFHYNNDINPPQYIYTISHSLKPDVDFNAYILIATAGELDIKENEIPTTIETLYDKLNSLVKGPINIDITMNVKDGVIYWEFSGDIETKVLSLLLTIELLRNMIAFLNDCANDKKCPWNKELKRELKKSGLYMKRG
jgi:hypothetical protein